MVSLFCAHDSSDVPGAAVGELAVEFWVLSSGQGAEASVSDSRPKAVEVLSFSA